MQRKRQEVSGIRFCLQDATNDKTSLTCAGALDGAGDVEFAGNTSSGRLVLLDGALSEYLVVGRNGSSPLARLAMVMRVDRSERGVSYSVETVARHPSRLRLRPATFDDLQQSTSVLQRMREFELIAGSRNSASRDEMKTVLATGHGCRTARLDKIRSRNQSIFQPIPSFNCFARLNKTPCCTPTSFFTSLGFPIFPLISHS